MGQLGRLGPGERLGLLDQTSGCEVQLSASGGRQCVVHRVPDQRVRKVETVAVLRDQTSRNEVVHQQSKLVVLYAEQPRQPRHRQRRPENRSGGQSSLRRLGEPGDPAPDGCLCGARGDTGNRSQTTRLCEPCHLRDEQRVAAGPGRDCVGLLGTDPAAGGERDEGPHVVLAEPAEEPGLAAGGHLRDHGELFGSCVRVVVPPAAGDQHRSRREVGGEEEQQPERALVDPVDVIEHQHDGTLAGEVVQHGDHRVEEREPPRRIGHKVRTALEQGTRALATGTPRLGRMCRGGGTKNLRPDPERRCARVFPAGTAQHQRIGRSCLDLGEQPGLADAGVTVHPQQAPASRANACQEGVDPVEQVVAAEQGRAVGQGLGTGHIWLLLRGGDDVSG